MFFNQKQRVKTLTVAKLKLNKLNFQRSYCEEFSLINKSVNITEQSSRYTSSSPKGRYETTTYTDEDNNIHQSLQWDESTIPHIQMRKTKPKPTYHQIIKVQKTPIIMMHGIKTYNFTDRVRWDDKKLINDYFGPGSKNINNFEQFKKKPTLVPQLSRENDNKRCSITSVMEMNPDQFEASLKICSRRFKADKYKSITRYISQDKWDNMFAQTQMMKLRQKQKVYREKIQLTILQTLRQKGQKQGDQIINFRQNCALQKIMPEIKIDGSSPKYDQNIYA